MEPKAAEKERLVKELRQRVAHIPLLPDEPDFNTKEETLVRYLKSRDWKLEDASRMLIDSIEYRRKTRPQLLDCSWCQNRPGFHSMRQVGHDLTGRPVVYSSFVQAATHKNCAEDSVAHVTYLLENGKRSMGPGVSTWVWVIDYHGMTLSQANPKLGYSVTSMFASHYPERLGLVVCINHGAIFHGIYVAMKQLVHPNTMAKVRLARNKAKMAELFTQVFGPELSAWLQEEIALNKLKPVPKTQLEFWNPPPKDGGDQVHDPRGCPSYVARYVEGYHRAEEEASALSRQMGKVSLSGEEKAETSADPKTPEPIVRVHKPHPNILEELNGHRQERTAPSQEEELEWVQAQEEEEMEARRERAAEKGKDDDDDDDDDDEDEEFFDSPCELPIPSTAVAVGASS